MKPAPAKSTAVTLSQHVPPSTSVAQCVTPVTIQSTVPVYTKQASSASSASTSPSDQAPIEISTTIQTMPTKAKSTLSINVVPPKPQSPTNTPPPMTNKPPSPVSQPAPVIGKPISSVPMYVPTAPAQITLASSIPTTNTLSVTAVTASPTVVVVQSLTPVVQGGDSRSTPPGRVTPLGRRTLLGKPGVGSLRQGVPQKPYTFMDEKSR